MSTIGSGNSPFTSLVNNEPNEEEIIIQPVIEEQTSDQQISPATEDQTDLTNTQITTGTADAIEELELEENPAPILSDYNDSETISLEDVEGILGSIKENLSNTSEEDNNRGTISNNKFGNSTSNTSTPEIPRIIDFDGGVLSAPDNLYAHNAAAHERIISSITAVDTAIESGDIPSSERKSAVIDNFLSQLEGFNSLSPTSQEALKEFLMGFDLDQLGGAEIQGKGGIEKGSGVTGSGVNGHFVNSILSSVSRLIETERLTPEVLASMSSLSNSEMHNSLQSQRNSVIRGAIQEIAFPESINQHARGTCAGATCQIHFAINEPARYLGVVQGLASESGNVPTNLISGNQRMYRAAGTLETDNSGRSISSRLVQAAFMEFANGDDVTYNNQIDEHSDTEDSGLSSEQGDRLLEGLYGENSFEMLDTFGENAVSSEYLMSQVEDMLDQGNPVYIGMRWRHGAHAVLATHIDRQEELVYFMNPQGDLQTMPLDDFIGRVNRAEIPSRPENHGQNAVSRLPGDAGDLEKYQPVSSREYQTGIDQIYENDDLNHLTNEQKDLLAEHLMSLFPYQDTGNDENDDFHNYAMDLSLFDIVDKISDTARNGTLSVNHLLERLQGIDDPDILSEFVDMYEFFSGQIGDNPEFTIEEAQEVLALYPEQNLERSDQMNFYRALVIDHDRPEVERFISMMRDNIAQDTMGIEDASTVTQDQVRERFEQLEGGWTNDEEYAQLEELSGLADSETKAYMIRELMNGATSSQAERAIAIIIGNAPPSQQNQILSSLNLERLGSELENKHQAAEMINVLTGAGFEPQVMETHLNSYFDGISSQNGWFNNFDDDVTRVMVHQLTEESLQALPASIKMRMFRALDNGDTTAREFAQMETIAMASSPRMRANMINDLMNGNTSSSQERVIYNILRQTSGNSSQELGQVLENVNTSRLANELQNDNQASSFASILARASRENSSLNSKLNSYLSRLASDHREDAVNSFVNNASSRGYLETVSGATLRNMANQLMNGHTNEDEENAIMNILNKASDSQLGSILGSGNNNFADRLISELDDHDIGNVLKRLATSNNMSAFRNMFRMIDQEHNGSSDDIAKEFVSRMSRQQLNRLPADVLSMIHTAMDEGWTTGSEERMMDRLEAARNWRN